MFYNTIGTFRRKEDYKYGIQQQRYYERNYDCGNNAA